MQRPEANYEKRVNIGDFIQAWKPVSQALTSMSRIADGFATIVACGLSIDV